MLVYLRKVNPRWRRPRGWLTWKKPVEDTHPIARAVIAAAMAIRETSGRPLGIILSLYQLMSCHVMMTLLLPPSPVRRQRHRQSASCARDHTAEGF